jgi:hypothetical protein
MNDNGVEKTDTRMSNEVDPIISVMPVNIAGEWGDEARYPDQTCTGAAQEMHGGRVGDEQELQRGRVGDEL